MAELSDKDIIKKIRNGKIDHYSYIVKKYTKIIFQFIHKKLFKKEDVDDLVQNVFISFYKSVDNFDENRPIKPYLFQIVQNELKMYFRAYKKTQPLDDKIAVEIKSDEILIDDLNILDNQEKRIFQHISEGYKYDEISKIIKKPLNTVKSIVRRVRLKFKK